MPATRKTKPVKAPRPVGALKPGYLTTEFWVTILSIVGLVVSSAAAQLPERYAAIAAAIAGAAYAISRGLAKLFPPKAGP